MHIIVVYIYYISGLEKNQEVFGILNVESSTNYLFIMHIPARLRLVILHIIVFLVDAQNNNYGFYHFFVCILILFI